MESQTLKFIEEHSVAIVSTCLDGQPHGVPVYYYFDKENNDFYFITKNQTKKYENLQQTGKAFLTIFDQNPPTVFTAECSFEGLECEGSCMGWVDKLIAVHSAQQYYPTPISMLKEGKLKLVKLHVEDTKFVAYRRDI